MNKERIHIKIKRHLLILSLFVATLLGNNSAFAQGECLGGGCTGGSQYPAGTQSTTSTTFVTVVTNNYAGEYGVYNVTNGKTYEWSLCAGDGGAASYDSQLMLLNSTGATIICYSDDYCGDDAKISWTATSTTTVRVLIAQWNCAGNATNTTVRWRCVDCGAACPVPGNDDACNATAMPTPLDGTNCLVGETNCGATAYWSGGCVPAGDLEVWYTATLTGANTVLNLSLSNTTFGGGNVNVLLTTKNDACPADANMTLIDNYCGGAAGPISFTGLTPGVQYHIGISTNVGNDGDFDICATEVTPGGGAGDDCGTATRIDCGDAVLVGETSVGNTDDENSWTCYSPINTPGGDHYYVVQWPDAVNGGAIRINLTNVVDGNDTYLELIALGSPCAPPACDDGGQLIISTGLFGTATNFLEYNVPAGITDYYFVIDSQNDGIDSYDIEVTCFTTGLELDMNNSCTPIPAGEPANQGYYQTWDGVAPPATADPAAMTGTYTICENVYILNVGWEWLKYFDVTLGECWINPTSFTPNGNNTGFHSLCGGAKTGNWAAALAGNAISWDFTHPTQGGCGNTDWGDGNLLNNNYSCQLYTFCYDANVDPTCNAVTGFQNGISATDDGIGAGAGSGVNPSNVTLGTTSPTVLPVTLLSFSAEPVLNNDKYGVVLNWKTSAEINNDYFTIERSVDGFEFEEVLRMQGAGNSTTLNNYFAVDENPHRGISYYRLKQTDFNGAFEYFNMVSVNISNIDDLHIFPNPVTSDLNISLKSKKENSEVFIKIYDTRGGIVFEQLSLFNKGLNESTVDMKDFSHGLYFITIENEGQIQKLKFIKE